MRTQKRRRELLWKVLSVIGNATIAWSSHPSRNSLSVYRAMRDFRELQAASDRQLRYISRYVIDKKYVTVVRADGRAELTVSAGGKKLLQKAAVMALKPKPQARWDRKYRIVLFDIPNYMKSARDAFAGTLKRLGFLPLQKSVFISPYPCEEELEVLVDYFDIEDHVDIIVAERISRHKTFASLFGLDSN